MRILIFIVMALLAFCSHASAVLWNAVELDRYVYDNGNKDYTLYWSSAYPEIPGIVDQYDLQVCMYTYPFNANNTKRYALSSYDNNDAAGSSSNWLEAREGDIAEAGTTRNRKYYFNHCHVDNETGWVNRDIYCDPDADIYLMFAVPSVQSQLYPDNMNNPECLYGWVHLQVDANGEIGLLGSAIGLDGQAMVVGVTPEPSAGMLLLLGCAMVALRRRR